MGNARSRSIVDEGMWKGFFDLAGGAWSGSTNAVDDADACSCETTGDETPDVEGVDGSDDEADEELDVDTGLGGARSGRPDDRL
jgi:hypothetical protein